MVIFLTRRKSLLGCDTKTTMGDSWLLGGLGAGEQKIASAILERCPARLLPAGSRRRISDLAQAEMLLVESGFVVIRAPSPGARHVVVAEAGAGSLLLAPSDHEHLQALTDSRVTALPAAQLESFLALPPVAATLLRGLETTLRRRQEAASCFGSVHHVDRVRRKLVQLGHEFGRVKPDGIRIEFPLSHDLLADMVASARETVTRSVDELQRSGFVARDGHTYRLLVAPEALDPSG
jgi:CRP/FNR family transcriptional regulator, anaerobic regulatory protein